MKKVAFFLMLALSILITNISHSYAKPRFEYGEPIHTYITEVGPDIVSYSKSWNTEDRLKEIYNELLNNFHSNEINFLETIYIYPDSPDGISGAYYESATINNNGKYEYKDDAYIEIFNGDECTDISQLSWVIAHEYGHHFTFYYLITSENKYFNQWYDTQYAKIRQLDKYKEVDYSNSDEDTYIYEWDITEIAAYDYVQLFGSILAKSSVDYKDITERMQENIVDYYEDIGYNSVPQQNLNIPLAVDVDGLYNYWLGLTGHVGNQPILPSKPIPYIKDKEIVYFGENTKYTVSWDEILDGNIYDYTVIMYPSGMPYFPIPVKTVTTGEKMVADIGSAVKYDDNGELYGILECMEGEYEIRIFIKDTQGFIFASETLYYDFTTDLSRYDENIVKHIAKSDKDIKIDHISVPFEPLSYVPRQKTYTDNFTITVLKKDNILENFPAIKYSGDKKYIISNERIERISSELMYDLTKDKFSDKSVKLSSNIIRNRKQ